MATSTSRIDELAFVRAQIERLAGLPVTLPDDARTPEANKPRRAHLVNVRPPSVNVAFRRSLTSLTLVHRSKSRPCQRGSTRPPSPARLQVRSLAPHHRPASQRAGPILTHFSGLALSPDTIALTIKSLKPPLTYPLTGVSLRDPISSLKAELERQHPTAPPSSHQRLLLKGKALADERLLGDYPIEEGTVIMLSIKPGFVPPPPVASSTSTDASAAIPPTTPDSAALPPSVPTTTAGSPSFSPSSSVPKLTLSTDFGSTDVPMSVAELATSNISSPHPTDASYHAVVKDVEFWEHLLSFLQGKFGQQDLAEQAWEQFLLSQKNGLSPSEVAFIRDRVGLSGMGGMSK